MNKLFYKTPPKEWLEGLPIGNGRLAAMVWGSEQDLMTLNHEWLWTGRNKNRTIKQSWQGLPLVREAILQGDKFKATALANSFFGGVGGFSGITGRVDDYQPAGEFSAKILGQNEFVSRELDIYSGIAKVCRKSGQAFVTGEFFSDCVGQCISARWEGTSFFSGEFCLYREPEKDTDVSVRYEQSGIMLNGSILGGIRFSVRAQLYTDGKICANQKSLVVENARYIHFVINIATSHNDIEKELSSYTMELSRYKDVKSKHCARFKELMGRVEFSLEEDKLLSDLTTDVRIQKIKQGGTDNGISKLYFDFGRYLLISSSVCGQLPANLQGKWNNSMTPPWNCDYHMDINLEMNYWMAEPANLPECARALIRFARSFLKSGKEVAKNLYNCRGVILPIQTDAWGKATPESYGWSVWIGAAPWIARHLWDRYRYSGDLRYLKNEAYEFFVAIAEFYEDYLQKDKNGVYQILPSQSPENTTAETGCFPVLIDKSSAMDVQLCYDALSYAILSAEILNIDNKKVERWKELRDNLPPFAIGKDGRLLEWSEEFIEKEPGHRHLSHLYGIYPSDLFTPYKRVAQYKAGIQSLKYRLKYGGGHTGWSRAWVSCLYARLGDSELFYQNFIALIQSFATTTLLDLHPPRIFQIDGNLGAVSAVIEAIVSYYDDTAYILQALPKEWQNGHLYGVKIPGGHILNICWQNGLLQELEVVIGFSQEITVSYQQNLHKMKGETGEIILLNF